MKRFFGLSAIVMIIALSSLEVGVTSCTKEITKYDTVIKTDTITRTDTVVKKDTALTLEILTAYRWQDQELRGVAGDSAIYYIRGGSNHHFDNDVIQFRTDKTGTYYFDNAQYSLTWDFANADNTKIVYTVNLSYPGPTVVTWDNIKYKNYSLIYDEYWTYGNTNSHCHIIRTPL